MSYPPNRHQNDSYLETGYDRERRRERRDDERDWRREPERFRRDHAASFADEDRPFDEEASRFAGRDREPGYFQRSASGPFGQRESSGFAGRGPKDYRRSDQRIQEEVCDRLTADSQIDAYEIQVSVKEGEVTLDGTVPERRMKRLAEDCAESVPGANQVHNRLRVDDSSRQQAGQGSQASQTATRQSSGRSAS